MRIASLIAGSALALCGPAFAQAPTTGTPPPAAASPSTPALAQPPGTPRLPGSPEASVSPENPVSRPTTPAMPAKPDTSGYNVRGPGAAATGELSSETSALIKPGATIKDAKGSTVGKVTRVDTDASGQPSSVVVNVGGMPVTLPASSLSARGGVLVTQLTQNQIRGMATGAIPGATNIPGPTPPQ